MGSGALRSGVYVHTMVTMKSLLIASTLILLSATSTAQTTVAVSVSPLDEMLVNREVRAAATVVSANEPVVTAQLVALVDAVMHDVGASVEKGDLLVRLDDANANLALAWAYVYPLTHPACYPPTSIPSGWPQPEEIAINTHDGHSIKHRMSIIGDSNDYCLCNMHNCTLTDKINITWSGCDYWCNN